MKTNKTKIQLSAEEMKAETTHVSRGEPYLCSDGITPLRCSGASMNPVDEKWDDKGGLISIKCKEYNYDPSNPDASGTFYILYCDESGTSGASGTESSIATDKYEACEGKELGADCEWNDSNNKRQSGTCEYDRDVRKYYCHSKKP